MKERNWRQLNWLWKQYKIRRTLVLESQIDEMIAKEEPLRAHYEEIQQKKYERRYKSENERQEKLEEAKKKPSEYWNYQDLYHRIYINFDKRRKQYFVQYINDFKYERRNERHYAETIEEAQKQFNHLLQEITVLIF